MLINMLKASPLARAHWTYHYFQMWRITSGMQWSVVFYSENMIDPCYAAHLTPASVIFSLKLVQCEGEAAWKLTFGYKAVDMPGNAWYHVEKMGTLVLHETTNFGLVLAHEPVTWRGRVSDGALKEYDVETHVRAFMLHMVRHWDDYKGETSAWEHFEAWMRGEPSTKDLLEKGFDALG